MTIQTDSASDQRAAIGQYADWYSRHGYDVTVEPPARELPEFLRPFSPDLIARRDDENVVVEVKTSSPESFDRIQRLANAVEHRAGWKLRVVYLDLADPEWRPPATLPDEAELAARLEDIRETNVVGQAQYLLLWSVIEAASRHRLASIGISPVSRITSSALIKSLLTEGIIEDDQYYSLRNGLALRNVLAHGFLNQPVDPVLFLEMRTAAQGLLNRPGVDEQ